MKTDNTTLRKIAIVIRNGVSLILFLALAACKPTQNEKAGGGDGKLEAVGKEIAKDVGTFVRATAAGKFGPVFVFEEYHNARIGQIQIATMLARLYHTKNLRTVGLEGAVQGPAPLPTDKFLGSADSESRRDVLKKLMRDAEISGAEYAGATLPGLKVVGIENASEYNVQMQGGGNAPVVALLHIAEKSLPQDKLIQVASKLNDKTIPEAERGKAAIEVMKAADPWLKARFDALNREDFRLADMVENNKAIMSKANSLGVKLDKDVREEMDSATRFYEAAEKRSDTMAENVTTLCKASPSSPVAMIIGAAHTEHVVARLEKNGVSAVVLRALNFKGDGDKEGGRGFVNKSAGKWANDAPGTLGAILNGESRNNTGERKPPPVIGNSKRDGYASAQAAAFIAARAVRNGDQFPDSLINKLKVLPGITVDPTSFKKDGYDVIFAFETEDTTGKMQKVWVRTGTKKAGAHKDDQTEAAIRELEKAESGGGGNGEPPKNDRTTSPDDPGDGKPGKPTGKLDFSITNREVQTKFFKTSTEAEKSAMISDI